VKNAFIVLSLVLCIIASPVFAATINVPADQPTIQAGINAAANGDTVLVAPGTYFENINFNGKALTVKSSGGPSATTINGSKAGSVVTFSSGELASSVLIGFTITNGMPTFGDGGGGIEISLSSPTILENTVTKNQACDGNGIRVYFGSPVIRNNKIIGNIQVGCSGGTGGGGIELLGTPNTPAQVIGNFIQGNNAGTGIGGGGISLWAAGTPIIMNNTFVGNIGTTGGAISMYNLADAMIVQNLFVNNSAGQGGGVYYLVPSGGNGPTLVNNTFLNNKATNGGQGSAIYANDYDLPSHLYNNIIDGVNNQSGAVYCGNENSTTPPVFFNNDVFASGGSTYGGICGDQTGLNGNISADPLFVSNKNLRLQATSPAIDAGDNSTPDLPKKDLASKPRIVDGNGDGNAVIDMGAYEFQPQ
jgi:predicted outer membrane repeat protein